MEGEEYCLLNLRFYLRNGADPTRTQAEMLFVWHDVVAGNHLFAEHHAEKGWFVAPRHKLACQNYMFCECFYCVNISYKV